MWTRRWNKSITWIALLSVSSLISINNSVVAFPVFHGSEQFQKKRRIGSLVALKRQTQHSDNKGGDSYYNDDAFGLLFLSGLLVEHDTPFAATFGILSGITAFAVKRAVIPFVPLLPGTIAAISFIVATGIHVTHGDKVFVWRDISKLELIVCAISIGLGILQQQAPSLPPRKKDRT